MGKYYTYKNKNKITYVAILGELKAHGDNIKEAISDVLFKHLQQHDVSEHVKRLGKE